ncbi:MAG: aminotransferase class I/II-fold pyridoxal phosphate-dependent enzyme [Bacteroidales bacterium]|nr:aminotransferase class I/II-fold pyridoxal phosphate-dependent enzyme [Bacteroidales bacterium]
MQAIILAAGMGKRLGEYTKHNTKCMVEVNGIPLIDRMLDQLIKLHLNRVVVVVGYEGQKLMDHLGHQWKELQIEYVINPIFDKTNNIYSLALAKQHLQEDDTLLLESDLIFDSKILDLLLNEPFPNVALVAKYESWMDGTMVRINEDNEIVSFVPKTAFKYSETGSYYKTVNIYKFSKEFLREKYVPFLEAYSKAVGNNEYYENVLRIISFLNNHDLKALPIGNEKWYEIDDKQDLDIAEALFAEEKDLLKKYYGRYGGFWRFPKMLDYCYLVNPYFPNSKIVDEMQANFRILLTEYPSGMKVNTLLASKCWGVKEDYVIPGNGAAELIKALMEFLPGSLGITRPTFEEYPNRRDKESLVTFIPKSCNYRYTAQDLMDYFGIHHADNILLINPDNPSGNFIPINDIIAFASWCQEQNTRLIVDESFVDFSIGYENNSLLDDKILEAHPKMVVMKSISKSYGVPGLRLGILASADKELITNLKKAVSIWNLNSFAEYFMQIFSKYEKDYYKACEKFLTERDRFEKELHEIPYLRVMPSQANYFLCEVLQPQTAISIVLTMLKKHNILLRDCSNKIGFDGKQYIRIAIRSHTDNNKLIEALRQI